MDGVVESHGKEVEPNGILKLNIGGKPLDVRRSTLTIAQNSMLAAMFSGRYDRSLPKDASGRFFVDDNPRCFQKLVEALQLRKIAKANDKIGAPVFEEDQVSSRAGQGVLSVLEEESGQ